MGEANWANRSIFTGDATPIDMDEGVDWMREKLKVPTGMLAGQSFQLCPYPCSALTWNSTRLARH
ncbi:MAG: hypothetical protein OXH77_00440 [Anaerolineaceae bacterium]|nr:hypothetical protein [Anaerolineaceae bacterium]